MSGTEMTTERRQHSATRRTLLALLATALGIVPLKAVLADNGWLVDAWATMLVVILPAALLRLRRAPSALDIWPGIVLLIPWLTAVFVHQHAWYGFIPNHHTWNDVTALMDSLHRTTHDEVAPIHSTVAVRLVICALVGLLAALTDLIAVVGRHGALAGVPLLAVYTVSGAIPRNPVAWFWFAIAAVGYLLLLGLDAEDELRGWGRRIARRGTSPGHPALAFSAQRIGAVAVAAAIILPFLIPAHSKNLISEAFRGGGGGNGYAGFCAGCGTSISPFAALKGQLTRNDPIPLMTVHIEGNGNVQPGYLVTNILEKVTGSGWQLGPDHGSLEPVDESSFPTEPTTANYAIAGYSAQITITGLTGSPAIFEVPTELTGVSGDSQWSAQDQLVLGPGVQSGQVIRETVAQPWPSVADLESAPSNYPPGMSRWLQLPSEPKSVVDQVQQLTHDQASPYDKARAISNFFADPTNGFTYSLTTQAGDSGSDLADFLQNRIGFCQQYAAAMGIMLRMAGIPARVVLGYMHPATDAHGNFNVTTFDAHAWVEAFFPGLGWVPFDPTPPAGLTGGKKADLPWAPHVFTSGNDAPPSINKTRSASASHGAVPTSSAPAAVAAGGSGGTSGAAWFGLAVLIVLLVGLLPAGVRTGRRRRRLLAARHGDADALWAELTDTAVDLGYTWSPARSPRQVSTWLGRDAAGAAGSLDALAGAVEQRRYAPNAPSRDTAPLARGLNEITEELRARRSVRTRIQARLWPASLGWGKKLGSLTAIAKRRR